MFQAAVDQTLAPNLYLNLGFSHETYFEKVGGYSTYPDVDSGLTMKVDPNRYLPDRVTLNPNFGKLFIEDIGTLAIKDYRQDAARASLSYELDLTRRPDALRWLGRYRALATWSWQLNDERSQPHRAVVGDGPDGPPSFVTGAAITNYKAPQRVFRMRYYLDTLADPASQGRYFKLPPGGGDPQETATITDPVSGRSFPVYLSQNPQGAFSAPAGTKREVTSAIVAVQNYLLRDLVVLTWLRLSAKIKRLKTRRALPVWIPHRRPCSPTECSAMWRLADTMASQRPRAGAPILGASLDMPDRGCHSTTTNPPTTTPSQVSSTPSASRWRGRAPARGPNT